MLGQEKVFVYGTLRPPQNNSSKNDSRYYFHIDRYVKAAEAAQLDQADLFNLGAYPAARPGAGTLYGDLLTLEPEALPIIDRIEGHPKFFRRERVVVNTGSGQTNAWIYWAARGLVVGMRLIGCGDWFRRQEEECRAVSSAREPAHHEAEDETLRALVKRFAEAECSWFNTVRPDDRAHSAPVWHVWYQGRAYVVTTPDAVKITNIAQNPAVVITHPDPINPVIIEGWATLAPEAEEALQPLFLAKYNWDIGTDADYGAIIEVTPTKLLAWGNHGEGRWDGEAVLQVWSV